MWPMVMPAWRPPAAARDGHSHGPAAEQVNGAEEACDALASARKPLLKNWPLCWCIVRQRDSGRSAQRGGDGCLDGCE